MGFQSFTYSSGNSIVHRCDARVKVLLMLAYSIAIFFVDTWWAMAAFVVAALAAEAVARVPVRLLAAPLVSVAVLALFAVVFAYASSPDAEGLAAGLFVAVRMVALVGASLIVCFTTTSTQLLRAVAWLIGPLRALHVPVDDVAYTLSLALRFIPVIFAELATVRMAQQVRGGDMPGLGFARRLRIGGAALSAVFVGLFRHADALADAMEARCYGASDRRTSLHDTMRKPKGRGKTD